MKIIVSYSPRLKPVPTENHHSDLNSASGSLCRYIMPHMLQIPTHSAFFSALGFIASYRQECVKPSLLRRSLRVKACSLALEGELTLSEDRARVMGPLIYGQPFVLCVRGGLWTDCLTGASALYRGNYSNDNECPY